MNKSNQWKRDTALFLTSQTISLFGSSLVQYAIMWYITLNTQSGMMMTIVRRIVHTRARSRSADPGRRGVSPQFVPPDKLTQVNATYTSIQSVVTLASPMVSGALLTMASIESIFFIDVATAAVAVAILLFLLRVPAHAKASAKQTSGYFADMREGYRYVKQHGYVKTFLAFSACFMFFAAPVAFLTPLQVARSFGPEVWRLTVIEVAFSLGMVVGGAVMAYWGGFRNRVYTMILANAIMG